MILLDVCFLTDLKSRFQGQSVKIEANCLILRFSENDDEREKSRIPIQKARCDLATNFSVFSQHSSSSSVMPCSATRPHTRRLRRISKSRNGAIF